MPDIKEQIDEEIVNQLKTVDYDTHEFTIEVILSKLKKVKFLFRNIRGNLFGTKIKSLNS